MKPMREIKVSLRGWHLQPGGALLGQLAPVAREGVDQDAYGLQRVPNSPLQARRSNGKLSLDSNVVPWSPSSEMRATWRVPSGVREHRVGAIGLALEACEQGLDDERIELTPGAALQLCASGFLAD
jgi:hypothetical protein